MKASILVVDDEKNIREAMSRTLEFEGHHVITAHDYESALEAEGKGKFDLLITDIVLGGKTGIELLKDSIKSNPLCPVVLITGVPSIETASEAVRQGAFDYIAKPVSKEPLLRVVNNALRYGALLIEREKYKKNLEAIFRSINDGIISVNSELRITDANNMAYELVGIQGDYAGKYISDFFNLCSDQAMAILKKTINDGNVHEAKMIKCVSAETSEKVFSLRSSPLMDEYDTQVGAILVVKDETRTASLEKELKQRREFYNIVGKSQKMQEIFSLIESVAEVDSTLLVIGESGTGKELIADAVHYLSGRSSGSLIKVNCAALPEGLLESELFGHIKGAFTGASHDKPGRFELAHKGTIFLDEIGDMSKHLQVKLLRVLQEKTIERVGESKQRNVDVRIVAATNCPLAEMVKKGEFRQDLYYRLKVIEIEIPPLRMRRDDIPLLVEHFITKFNRKLHKNIKLVADSVLEKFMQHDWPGNIRELENTLEYAMVLCHDTLISEKHLPRDFAPGANTTTDLPTGNDAQRIRDILVEAKWNKTKAAKILGVSRRTLYNWMDEHGIEG